MYNERVAFDKQGQNDKIHAIQEREEEDLARILAKKYEIPYLDLTRISIDLDSLKLVREQDARYAGIAIVQSAGRKLQVAVKNPDLRQTKEIISGLRRDGHEVELFLGSIRGLERVWSLYKEISDENATDSNIINISKGNLADFRKNVKNTKELGDALGSVAHKRTSTRTTELLEMVLAGSFELEASDIHIEPQETSALIRLRIDGVLQDIVSFPLELYKSAVTRIKLVSEMKLNVHNKPQDGRFTIRSADTDIEVRVSTLPGPYGESTVMRILHPKAIGLTLEDLGMQPPMHRLLERELKKPNGMIMTTGPTGSGKTTTLYALIKKMKEQAGIKIITIEDPIEYHVQGITQSQVNKQAGYTFESGLSSIVRQDPDVILVGEIRNKETAEIAMHAALTGHLVFSTLHTNNAPATIPRIIDLGVHPSIIAPAVNLAIAQRLVRRLCKKCKKKVEPSANQMKILENVVSKLPSAYERPDLSNISIFEATGCGACNHTGYKGRIGIYEAFNIDDEIEQLILKNPTETAITEAALRQGMIRMRDDGILKILSGFTTFSELDRVAGD